MTYRTANYAAFYVAEPFTESNLGAHRCPDFVYYNLLRAWKSNDDNFPFIDAHQKTYNVRDNSCWQTLKSRLHQRLNLSKNIILFLSKNTKNSRALHEEISYGIELDLPIIIIYPDLQEVIDIKNNNQFTFQVRDLWNRLPILRDHMNKILTLHIPLKKEIISKALLDDRFVVGYSLNPAPYFYT